MRLFSFDERRNVHDAGDDERRAWPLPVASRVAAGSNPMIEGYGARFNEETIINGIFREKFAPGSLDDSFRTDDILVTFNHDANCLLGRKSNGTASFRSDAAGGLYSVALNANDPAAMSVLAKVQRRDVTGSSLVFRTVNPDDEEWRTEPGQLPLRIIKRAQVVEMGPVSLPCYPETTAMARSRAALAQISGATGSVGDADRLRVFRLASLRTTTPSPLPISDAARLQQLQLARSNDRPMFASDAHRGRAIARMKATNGAREYAFTTGATNSVTYYGAR